MTDETERTEAEVIFQPSGRRGRFALGTDLLTAARALGVDLDSICGGRGLCGRCQVTVLEGAFDRGRLVSRATHLEPPGETERRYARRRGLAQGRRLGCQARLVADVAVEVPPESQVHRPLVRKPLDARVIPVEPVLRLHYVQVQPPQLDRPRGDRERLFDALAREWGLADLALDASLLPALQRALREQEGRVTVAVRDGREVVAIWPGFRERALGLAVDVGSTTLAAQLCDLTSGAVLAVEGAVNPQIRFGEDLMSRVSYAMSEAEGRERLTRAVRQALDGLAAALLERAGAPAEELLEWVCVGNPIMHHLLLGLDPAPLGTAPFTPAVSGAVETSGRALGLFHTAPAARVYLPPLVAGHVGADCAAALLAEAPREGVEPTLIVDVGTNAEIVLVHGERILACSSPTGPALEGAQISCGQRAAPGAIERVRIDPDTLEPRIRVIGCERWSDEEGFREESRELSIGGLCGSGIIEAVAEMYLAGIIDPEGRIDGRLAARSDRFVRDGRGFAYRLWRGERDVVITQADVRAVQLAKAALYAGARLLMERAGIARIGRIVLAGAFGSHIDPLYALLLGMIPDCPPQRVRSAGNAAGTGARIALLNRSARDELAALVARIEKVETAIEPGFQEHFVAALAVPHAHDPYPHLERALGRVLPRVRRGAERRRTRRRA